MKQLLIDITFLTYELKRKRPPHGVPRVILAYVRHYLANIQLVYRIQGRIFILPQEHSQAIGKLLLSWDSSAYKSLLLLLFKGILASKRLHAETSYFLLKLDQNGMRHPRYFAALAKQKLQPIILMHDIFPIDYPEYSDPNYAKQFTENIKSSLRHAKGVICVSQVTKNAVERFADSANIQSPPMMAAPLAAGLEPNIPRDARLVEGPYFVIISTLVARKNHLLLLYIWRDLAKRLGEKAPKLVIIGKRSPECSTTLALLDRCRELRDVVIETQCTDEQLSNYLHYATALLFPTFAEGYGLPLMEALCNQVPVIASDLPIFHEIAGNIPDYLDPIDGKGWMQLIEAYAKEGSSVRQAQLQRIQQFQAPSWQDHFAKVDAFLTTMDVLNAAPCAQN